MHIGTPLTASATKVMLLGSGELGKEIAICCQRLGLEVIAVDRYENAPAQQVAHSAHVIDMTDPIQLEALLAREKPHWIVPEIEALATDTLARIEERGLATVVPCARAVQLTMDREGIRRLAAEELGLPTSRYAFAASLEELEAAVKGVGLPCFVKPTMSSSGKGQSHLTAPDQISAAWDKARSGGRVDRGRVIVEEKIDFDFEITLLTVRALDESGRSQIHFCQPIGHRQEQGDYVESWQPQPMTPKALEAAQAIAARVVEALGGLGLFGVELFVKGDQVWFSEVSPRPHDTGMVTMASQVQSEFELHVRAFLGLPVDTTLRRPGASAVIYGSVEGAGLVYEGIENALAVPESSLRLFGKPLAYPRRRMGVALATAETIEAARQGARRCAAGVRPELG
ncbi:phosphoribosylglycinamide formyltransferase 2 [Methylomarinovum caldicuralii]|uniref:Formate-dependent phosphoribosylglycinamide formyltransferase n=1 Tax=Methylomarinovum caldicuralii TaxID=438856 RepID=A0AAU9C141_9GAMM|nr:formate-dependent phosphoribosylglycinamide formyltransferase [Methylomarinovum caldicuralii]BCX82037.1 phosphoribosylglycinamide formyltransferase 2 [Methylomarinovum caldicuralii]